MFGRVRTRTFSSGQIPWPGSPFVHPAPWPQGACFRPHTSLAHAAAGQAAELSHRRGLGLHDLGAVWAVPLANGRRSESDALIVEPLERALIVVARDHLAVRGLLAIAVQRLVLLLHWEQVRANGCAAARQGRSDG
eukprot:353034-Chlamydomonas_euryale.AAC.2